MTSEDVAYDLGRGTRGPSVCLRNRYVGNITLGGILAAFGVALYWSQVAD